MTEIVEYFEADSPYIPWAAEATTHFMRSLGLPPYAVESLLQKGRLETHRNGDVLAYGSEWIHIIIRGVIKETTPHGTTRLWRQGTMLGDISRVMLRKGTTDPSGARSIGPRITFLSTSISLSVTTRTLATMIEREPILTLLLAQLTNERAQTIESVYAVSKADPGIRVARLLDYLAPPQWNHPKRQKGVDRLRWTRTGMYAVPEDAVTLTGPSQVDIADALGLGRTTVEKVVASLRADGILNVLAPGTRSNRYYEIGDRHRLRAMAMARAED
jgi:biotin operon repressor